eukprot:3495625-Amphidinium_carterae.2
MPAVKDRTVVSKLVTTWCSAGQCRRSSNGAPPALQCNACRPCCRPQSSSVRWRHWNIAGLALLASQADRITPTTDGCPLCSTVVFVDALQPTLGASSMRVLSFSVSFPVHLLPSKVLEKVHGPFCRTLLEVELVEGT